MKSMFFTFVVPSVCRCHAGHPRRLSVAKCSGWCRSWIGTGDSDDSILELSNRLRIQNQQEALAEAWKPYMKNLDNGYEL